MSEIVKFAERATVLCDIGEGLCCRLYKEKSDFLNGAVSYQCFVNPDWQKVRSKLEKAFPEIPNMTKVAGFESVMLSCPNVMNELAPVMDMMLELDEFLSVSYSTLMTFSSKVTKLDLSFNRSLCLLFMNLMRAHVRCYMLLASMNEKKGIISCLNACYVWTSNEQLSHMSE